MVWRLPFLRKTLNSLQLSSQNTPTLRSQNSDTRHKGEAAKDLARKRLDQADAFSESRKLDISQQLG